MDRLTLPLPAGTRVPEARQVARELRLNVDLVQERLAQAIAILQSA